jgi:hypothetical protein
MIQVQEGPEDRPRPLCSECLARLHRKWFREYRGLLAILVFVFAFGLPLLVARYFSDRGWLDDPVWRSLTSLESMSILTVLMAAMTVALEASGSNWRRVQKNAWIGGNTVRLGHVESAAALELSLLVQFFMLIGAMVVTGFLVGVAVFRGAKAETGAFVAFGACVAVFIAVEIWRFTPGVWTVSSELDGLVRRGKSEIAEERYKPIRQKVKSENGKLHALYCMHRILLVVSTVAIVSWTVLQNLSSLNGTVWVMGIAVVSWASVCWFGKHILLYEERGARRAYWLVQGVCLVLGLLLILASRTGVLEKICVSILYGWVVVGFGLGGVGRGPTSFVALWLLKPIMAEAKKAEKSRAFESELVGKCKTVGCTNGPKRSGASRGPDLGVVSRAVVLGLCVWGVWRRRTGH